MDKLAGPAAGSAGGDGDAAYRVRVKVVNRGELSTSLTNRGRVLARRCPPVQAKFIPSEGAAVASASAVAEVGVLAGVVGAAECEWFVTAACVATAASNLHRGVISGDTSLRDCLRLHNLCRAGMSVLGTVEIEGGIAADVVVDVASV